jgi:hypothetical protein
MQQKQKLEAHAKLSAAKPIETVKPKVDTWAKPK